MSKASNLLLLKQHNIKVPSFDIIKWEDKDKKIDNNKYKGLYAIRSSANIEDGQLDSFAGQFDTYLNVKDYEINEYVSKCFNSVNNDNIKEYLESKKISVSDIKMDVIIQEMIDSDYSGVLFTSNPSGLFNETVIVVGKGLGNGIVEDKVDTTTYYYNVTDKVYYYEGTEDYIDDLMIDTLINLSYEIQNILGDCLDIEFSIKDNEIYILQARHITTLNTEQLTILDNSNIVESYPGISSPLTISFVKFVYSGVFKGVSYRILKNQKVLDKYSSSFNNMVSSSNGRLYYKISNWYTLIKFLPFNKKIIPIWQDMLGVKNKSYDNEKVEVPFFTRINTYFNSIKELKRAPKNMAYLNNKFIEINNYYRTHFNENLTNDEIKELFNKIRDEVLSIWDITLINDMYSFIYTGLLKKKLNKKYHSMDKVNDYISGISNIESLKPIHELIKLAYDKDKISEKDFKNRFEHYIDVYGDRNLEELKLESKTFRTNPELLTEKINEYREDLRKLDTLYQNINVQKEINNKEDFITRFVAKRAMIGIKNREISRLNRARIYGMVREMFTTIGKNLVKEEKIDNYLDIYYLTMDELFDNSKEDLKDIIKSRKNDYLLFKELPNYSRLVFTGSEMDKTHKTINMKQIYITKDELKGTGTSDGIVEGKALVIDDISKKYDVKDKILITKMTDPGWVFLLATAKGVISEKGSILSHTAIISRELKIPSVVGVDNVTRIIKTGDYIKMDGTSGDIEIIERSK